MKTLAKVLVVLVVLVAGGAVAAENVGADLATDKIAAQIAARGELPSAPVVDLGDGMFLPQALSGTYDRISFSLDAAQLRQPAGASADITLDGVQVSLTDALSGNVDAIPVDQITGTVTLPYDVLSAQLEDGTTVTRDGDVLRIARTVDAAGQPVGLTATGPVTLIDGQLVIDASGDVTAVDSTLPAQVLAMVIDEARSQLIVRQAVPTLPFGLTPTSVVLTDAGIVLTVSATNAVLGG